MWCDWSKSAQVSRQATCSSRQFVNSGGHCGVDVRADLGVPRQLDRAPGCLQCVLQAPLCHCSIASFSYATSGVP